MGRKKSGRKVESPSKRRIPWPRWTGFRGKTVWDWMDLLIVPLGLAILGYSFTLAVTLAGQDISQQVSENQQAQQEAMQLRLEEQRAQESALQTYLDVMRQLMLDEDLKTSEPDSSVRAIANAQTLSTLGRLDTPQEETALLFLRDAGLIKRTRPSSISITPT